MTPQKTKARSSPTGAAGRRKPETLKLGQAHPAWAADAAAGAITGQLIMADGGITIW